MTRAAEIAKNIQWFKGNKALLLEWNDHLAYAQEHPSAKFTLGGKPVSRRRFKGTMKSNIRKGNRIQNGIRRDLRQLYGLLKWIKVRHNFQ